MPSATDRYRIRLDGFSASVCVKLGEREIPLGMSPIYAIVDGGALAEAGDITVTVANTALNEIAAKKYVIEAMPKAEQGEHYKKKLSAFEERKPEIRFGKVYIEKLK